MILNTVVRGDTVREVLDYVQFNSKTLLEESALRKGKIGCEESGRLLRVYEDGLNEYTYLVNVFRESPRAVGVPKPSTPNSFGIRCMASVLKSFMRWRCLLLLLLLLPILLLSAQPGEEEVWRDFLTWLKTAKSTDSPATIFTAFQDHLVSRGASAIEAQRQHGIVTRLMRTRDDGWQVMFNNIYSSKQPGFSVRPNGTLVAAVERRKPGRALDAGMGQGRNAVFLALKGWDVTGFDISDEGLAIARKDASKAGVKIRTVHSSGGQFDYGTGEWDLIVFSYVPFPLTDPAFVRRLTAALRPGGLVVVESFASDSSAKQRKPVDIDPPRMKAAFEAEFNIHRLEDRIDTPDWTTEESRLVRMVAEKKK